MVQWFKRLFTKKKESGLIPLLSRNQEQIQSFLEGAALDVFGHRTESSAKIIRSVIEAERNSLLFRIAALKPDAIDLARHQGRLEMATALIGWIDDATNEVTMKALRERRNQESQTAEKRVVKLRRGPMAESII